VGAGHVAGHGGGVGPGLPLLPPVHDGCPPGLIWRGNTQAHLTEDQDRMRSTVKGVATILAC